MKYTISINRKWCKKCGLCAYYCPKKVYELDEFNAPVIKNPDACVGCMQCEYRCPDFSIEIFKAE